MSYRVTAICDKCKKEETQEGNYIYGPQFNKEKVGWGVVEIKISQYNHRNFLLCKECRKELGLLDENERNEPKVESVSDRLFDVISEIVSMNQQQ